MACNSPRYLHLKYLPLLSVDYSFKVNLAGTLCHQIGTALDLLTSHASGGHGKILNALDFPMPCLPPENFPPPALASNVAAFQTTAGMQHCPSKDGFPFTSMRCGLAATEGSYHT